MRKILVTSWVSLDGFTAGANGEMDWITAGEDNGEYQNEVVTQADTLLLGRTTYESFAGAWPQRARDPNTDPGERAFAQRFCDMRKVVISQSLPTVEWEHSTLLREIDPAEILKLKQEPGKDIAIYGSASIVR
ncbi:MAG TPA: dihydrofolate reductase family protein, partial [Ktedonosporobacter sp.]|nr:dihydrofolate reductase family protein [Ktedonosporobacter sp.]